MLKFLPIKQHNELIIHISDPSSALSALLCTMLNDWSVLPNKYMTMILSSTEVYQCLYTCSQWLMWKWLEVSHSLSPLVTSADHMAGRQCRWLSVTVIMLEPTELLRNPGLPTLLANTTTLPTQSVVSLASFIGNTTTLIYFCEQLVDGVCPSSICGSLKPFRR